MKKNIYFLFFIMVGFTSALSSQDKLFTQAFAHPVDINPSFAGVVDGRYRVSIAYRDQWRSIVESAFTTMGIYGDLKITTDARKDDFFGAGFSLITDRTAIYNVNQNMLSLYGSYHKSLNPDMNRFLSGGINIGIAQRNINYENIFFDDQFNGLDDYSLGTAENLPANNFAFFDVGAGISYTSSMNEFSSMSLGVSVDHLPGSSISFYHHTLNPDEEFPDVKIYRKFTGYASFELASNESVSILPRLMWQKQGPHQMLSTAAVVKFDITNYDNQAFHVGAGLRMNQTTDAALKPSTAFVMAAYQLQGLLIGLSHDILLTNLSADDPGKGAFELSISFTGMYDNSESMCPTF